MNSLDKFHHYFTRVHQSYLPKKLTEQDTQTIDKYLSVEFKALFYSQPLCDQRHGLLVFDKAKRLFKNIETVSIKDLLYTSLFHDIAKSSSFKNVTMRVFSASILSVVNEDQIKSKFSSKREIGNKIITYSDHSELSANMLMDLDLNEFVIEATRYHHSSDLEIEENCSYPDEVKLFIEADNL